MHLKLQNAYALTLWHDYFLALDKHLTNERNSLYFRDTFHLDFYDCISSPFCSHAGSYISEKTSRDKFNKSKKAR
jgi:hypothetical protein